MFVPMFHQKDIFIKCNSTDCLLHNISSGKTISSKQLDNKRYLKNEFAYPYINSYFATYPLKHIRINQNGYVNFTDTLLNIYFKDYYLDGISIENDLFILQNKSLNTGVLHKSGVEILPFNYKKLVYYPKTNQFATYNEVDHLFKIITSKDTNVLKNSYYEVKEEGEYLIVKKSNKLAILDKEARRITDFDYDEIESANLSDPYFIAQNKEGRFLLNAKGISVFNKSLESLISEHILYRNQSNNPKWKNFLFKRDDISTEIYNENFNVIFKRNNRYKLISKNPIYDNITLEDMLNKDTINVDYFGNVFSGSNYLEKEYIDRNKHYIVTSNNRKGIFDAEDKEILPIIYRDIKLMDTIYTLQSNSYWVLEEGKHMYKLFNFNKNSIRYQPYPNKFYNASNINYFLKDESYADFESIITSNKISARIQFKTEEISNLNKRGIHSGTGKNDLYVKFDEIRDNDEFMRDIIKLSAKDFSNNYIITKSGIPISKNYFENLYEFYNESGYSYSMEYKKNDSRASILFNNELKRISPKFYFSERPIQGSLIPLFRKKLPSKKGESENIFKFNENLDSSGVINYKGKWVFKPTIGISYYVFNDNLVTAVSKINSKYLNSLYGVKGDSTYLIHPNCSFRFPFLKDESNETNKDIWIIDKFGNRLNKERILSFHFIDDMDSLVCIEYEKDELTSSVFLCNLAGNKIKELGNYIPRTTYENGKYFIFSSLTKNAFFVFSNDFSPISIRQKRVSKVLSNSANSFFFFTNFENKNEFINIVNKKTYAIPDSFNLTNRYLFNMAESSNKKILFAAENILLVYNKLGKLEFETKFPYDLNVNRYPSSDYPDKVRFVYFKEPNIKAYLYYDFKLKSIYFE